MLTNSYLKNYDYKGESIDQLSFKKSIQFIKSLQKQMSPEPIEVLFVGNNKNFSGTVSKLASIASSQHSIQNQWIPGLLSNWLETLRAIDKHNAQQLKLQEFFQKQLESENIVKTLPSQEAFPYKQINSFLMKDSKIGGLTKMDKLPHIIIFLDTRSLSTALREAQLRLIPSIAIVPKKIKKEARDVSYPIFVEDTDDLLTLLTVSNTLVQALRT